MRYVRDGELREGPVPLAASAPAFRQGVGLFETVLYNGRALCHLEAHVARLADGLAALALTGAPTDVRADALRAVRANGLERAPARVNVFCPVVDETGTVATIVTAAPYPPPAPGVSCRLCPASAPVQLPLLRHKSMGNMLLWLERRRARGLGYDDAVLALPDGALLETTTAALLFGDGARFVTPATGDRLPSVTLGLARRELPVEERRLTRSDLVRFPHAYILNALVGMRPVAELDGVRFTPDERSCGRVTARACG